MVEGKNPFDNFLFSGKNENDEKNKRIEDISKIISEWLNDKHINAKTRLSKNQVIAISILKTLADKYNIKPLKELLKNYQTYKLSEEGESSKELVEILKERVPDNENDNSIISTVGKFLEGK